MSRRHAPTTATPLIRLLGLGLTTLLAFTVLAPATVVAQNDQITPSKIQYEWQLLRQLDANGELQDVPAGVEATMLMRSGFVSGEAACSTYESSYTLRDNQLSVFVEPGQIQQRECDPESEAFDQMFYDNLRQITSISRADSALVVNNEIGKELMRFTRARIEDDPTTTRWSLARIGEADGSVDRVIQGLDPWVEFLRGGSLVGSTGCGSFLGKYATNEGRVDITDVHYRLGACTDGARNQAERILTTLDEVTDFRVGPAGLALQDEFGTTRLALTPDLELAGRIWTPTAVYDANGREVYEGNILTTSAVQFIGGTLEGRSICRPFRGKALRSGLAVSIGDIEFLEKASTCRGRVGDIQKDQVEEAFIVALEDTSSYALRGDELALTDVEGNIRALLEPQPPLTGTTWELFRMRQGKRLIAPGGDGPITSTFEDVDATRVGVVQGKTGVSNTRGENEYFGTFESRAATVIDVLQLQRDGKGCNTARDKKTRACRQEALFLKLLESADGYIARDEDLKFYRGANNILVFRPQRAEASAE